MTAQAAARLADLVTGTPSRVLVDGVAVALVRTGDTEVRAVGDVCTHADVSLSEGEVELDDCTIECWLHGSTFDLITGKPQSLPAIRPVPVFPVTIDAGDVFVDVTTTLGEAPAPGAVTVKES